jgi:hypothetical protein
MSEETSKSRLILFLAFVTSHKNSTAKASVEMPVFLPQTQIEDSSQK